MNMPRREAEEWFWQIGNEMSRLAEELNRTRPTIASGRSWEPRVDLIEEEHRFLLKAEIAGVKGEEIQLLYMPERHAILIRGNRPEEDPVDGCRTGIHQLEILYGEFQREVRLPDVSIDASNIRATYRNGFLLVMIPKQDRLVVTRTVTFRKV
jgi:HSP20 family protein